MGGGMASLGREAVIKEARDYFWKQCSIVNVIYIVLFIFRLKVVSYLQTRFTTVVTSIGLPCRSVIATELTT